MAEYNVHTVDGDLLYKYDPVQLEQPFQLSYNSIVETAIHYSEPLSETFKVYVDHIEDVGTKTIDLDIDRFNYTDYVVLVSLVLLAWLAYRAILMVVPAPLNLMVSRDVSNKRVLMNRKKEC